MLERDSRSGQPLWMLLFTLLRSGCTHDVIEAYLGTDEGYEDF